MKVKITPSPLTGLLSAISSKSHAHRLLIGSALSQIQRETLREPAPGPDPFGVSINGTSEDIEATVACLEQLWEAAPALNCRESGSTLRFLAPVTMALRDSAVFFGEGRLPQRPMDVLTEQMEAHGCRFVRGSQPKEIFSVSGRLCSGDFHIPGNISSQYITGLLFALPLLKGDSRIIITLPLESSGYVDLSLEVLKTFNIQYTVANVAGNMAESLRDFMIIEIPGSQKYTMPRPLLHAEGDWSNSAFWLVAGVLGNSENLCGITCTGLNPDSMQGDRAVTSIINRFGGKVSRDGTSYTSSPGLLSGITIDAAEIPDLVPILSVLACKAKGTTEIINAGRLRIKESDRLKAVTDCLMRLGADIKELPEGLVIEGTGSLSGGTVSSYNDHRIAMSMAVAGAICTRPVIIEGANAVNKSYPRFWQDFRKLGGDFHVL